MQSPGVSLCSAVLALRLCALRQLSAALAAMGTAQGEVRTHRIRKRRREALGVPLPRLCLSSPQSRILGASFIQTGCWVGGTKRSRVH